MTEQHSEPVVSAESFRQDLYRQDILKSNFDLRFVAVACSDPLILEGDAATAVPALRALTALHINRLADPNQGGLVARSTVSQVRRLYFETFASRHLASYAFALWFYNFDEDNWFTFEGIRTPIEKHFSSAYGNQQSPVFYLIKGFDQRLLTPQGIVVNDLPVTVNAAEKQIYLWRGQLFD